MISWGIFRIRMRRFHGNYIANVTCATNNLHGTRGYGHPTFAKFVETTWLGSSSLASLAEKLWAAKRVRSLGYQCVCKCLVTLESWNHPFCLDTFYPYPLIYAYQQVQIFNVSCRSIDMLRCVCICKDYGLFFLTHSKLT